MDDFVLTIEEQNALASYFAYSYIHYDERGRIIRRVLDRLDEYKNAREREQAKA